MASMIRATTMTARAVSRSSLSLRPTQLPLLLRGFADSKALAQSPQDGQYSAGYDKHRKEVTPKLAGVSREFDAVGAPSRLTQHDDRSKEDFNFGLSAGTGGIALTR